MEFTKVRNLIHASTYMPPNSSKYVLFEIQDNFRSGMIYYADGLIIKDADSVVHVFTNDIQTYTKTNTNNLRISKDLLDKHFDELTSKYTYEMPSEQFFMHVRQVEMFDTDFYEQVTSLINANKKLLSPIIQKYYCSDISEFTSFLKECADNKDTNIPLIKYILLHFGNTPNILAWVWTRYVKGALNSSKVNEIYVWLQEFSKCSNKLSKKTITAYNTSEDIVLLMDEINYLRDQKRTNDVINTFNTEQRKMLKGHIFSFDENYYFHLFSKLNPIIKSNFIKKVSNFNNLDEILSGMKLLLDGSFEWSIDKLKGFINEENNIKANIVYEKDNILILEVFDYYSINLLAKTTNWCIAKQKLYWNDYIGSKPDKRKQYIIFNFNLKENDTLSIIGVTSQVNYGILYSHSFVNDNLAEASDNYNVKITPIVHIPTYSIFNIIREWNIPTSVFNVVSDFKFKWDYDEFIKYFYDEISNEANIVFDKDKRVVVKTTDLTLSDFLGSDFNGLAELAEVESNTNILLFLDFNRNDDESIIFGGYYESDSLNIEYVRSLYNLAGDELKYNLSDLYKVFGVEETLLTQANTVNSRFYNACEEIDLKTLNFLAANYDLTNILRERNNRTAFCELLSDSLTQYRSLDVYNIIKDNGYELTSLFSKSYLKTLFGRLFGGALDKEEEVLVRKDIKIHDVDFSKPITVMDAKNNRLENCEKILLFKTLFEKENNFDIEEEILNRSEKYADYHAYSSYVLDFIRKHEDKIFSNNACKEKIISIAFRNELNEVIDYISKNMDKFDSTNVELLAMDVLPNTNSYYEKFVKASQNEIINEN